MSYFKLIFGDQCCVYALSQCLTWELLYTTASSILGYTYQTPFRLTFYCMKTWKMVELDENVFNREQIQFQRQNVEPVSIYVIKDDFQAQQTFRTGVEVSHSSDVYSDTFSCMDVALMGTTDQSSSEFLINYEPIFRENHLKVPSMNCWHKTCTFVVKIVSRCLSLVKLFQPF